MNIGGAFCGGRHFIKRSIVLVEWIFMGPIGSNLLKKQVRSDVEWLKCCRNDVVTRNSLSFQILMPADEAFCMRRLTRYYNFPGLKTDWGNFWESETHWLSLIYAPSSSWIPERELCRLLRLPKLQNYVKIWSMSESFKIAMEQSILKSLQRTLWGKFDWGYRTDKNYYVHLINLCYLKINQDLISLYGFWLTWVQNENVTIYKNWH